MFVLVSSAAREIYLFLRGVVKERLVSSPTSWVAVYAEKSVKTICTHTLGLCTILQICKYHFWFITKQKESDEDFLQDWGKKL